jgi:hypothetical protein
MENSFLIHFWKLKIIIMDAEFLFYLIYSFLNWKKRTSRKKYLVYNFKCLLLEHTFANNVHGMGQIIKSSGNDTRSEPTLDSCLA